MGIGLTLVASSPIVGLLPGPGGVIVLAFGLGLTLRNSRYARKVYVRFRKKWPRYGGLTERALQTARRKRLRRQLQAEKAKKNDPE